MKAGTGYKKNETRLIPVDWEEKYLSDISEILMGQSPIGTSYNSNGKGTPLINGPTEFTKRTPNKIQWTSLPTKLCKEGDILICVRGSSTGRINISDDEYCIGRGVAAIRAKGDSNQLFLEYQINDAVKKLLTLTTGSTFPNIDGKTIREIKVVQPSTKTEQTAIANALFEIDSLISSIEKLIVKKQNIKQAAMQVLLTGKKRLKGFKGEWPIVKLGAIGDTYGGLSGKSKKDFDNGASYYIPFLNIMNNPVIDTDFFDMVSIRQGENQNKVRKGDLLFNGSSETPEEVGMCSILLNEIPDLYLNSFCFGFRLKRESLADGQYLIYFLRSNEGRKLIYSLAQGATRYNLSKSNFLQLEIPLPKFNEQVALAQVFSDMDLEIESLQSQLSKYKFAKQGMMQSLLTGKVRLVNPSSK